MDSSKSLKSKPIHLVYSPILHANRWLKKYKKTIWLIGSGRSGTTWISNLINNKKQYREMFEPFHPMYVKSMNFLDLHQYARPNEPNKRLEEVATKVFTGQLTNRRVDFNNRSVNFNGLLIKDIFANLFSYWASLKFPNIEIIFLLRNPFAVALSKYKKRSWGWLADPEILLNQKKLYEDYLYQFENLIIKTSKKDDYILNQILIWAITNYIPLQQFTLDEITIIFYEEVYNNPNQEISKLFSSNRATFEQNIDDGIINSPSRVAGKESTIAQNKSPIISWKNELSVTQIDSGLAILEKFGLNGLYNDSPLPDRNKLYHI